MFARNLHARRVAPLLFGSGLCALIYQVVWTKEFRLVFGASTAASAAVLAIFIGGLGLGGMLLGKRADRHPDPLLYYAKLETVIAFSASATPGLLWLVRWIYVHAGGTMVMGLVVGTAARLVLAALVLAVPTVLMGGTLPAAARAVEGDEDHGRRDVALLYGVNTLGAVTGSLLATFLLLEMLGSRSTLWCASLMNLLVALAARRMSRLPEMKTIQLSAPTNDEQQASTAANATPAFFVLSASALVGFAFFLMELVWYRLLGPLLGGTVFTFGLILALALLGIGLGGTFYAFYANGRPPSLRGLAATCLLEAAALVIPFALGDRLAVLTVLLRPIGNLGFAGHVASWSMIAGLVVLPAAFVAGVQFPMLIALMGRARTNVGREIGLVYAWNTVGSIVGALAGGFGLIPALSAPGCWRLASLLLAGLGVLAALIWAAENKRWLSMFLSLAASAAVVMLSMTLGPTAAWRHSPIGAGRVNPQLLAGTNKIRHWLHGERKSIRWEVDGVESSVALNGLDGWAFVVNGKIDGNAIMDAGTAVMAGLVGAALHPEVQDALVIGLGTGSTAGWLGAVPAMRQVDVVEIESAILQVAKACAPINLNMLENPKVKVSIGDAREVLLTTPKKYDLIVSEPSNPYRAGIASLFTREYYEAVANRLNEGGLFLQWVQAYEIDGQTVRSVLATLASVLPEVQTWYTLPGDLLLVGSKHPVSIDPVQLRKLIATEPFKTALAFSWRTSDLEGFLGHFLAGSDFARAAANLEGNFLNTDNQNYVEFAFARGISKVEGVPVIDLLKASRGLKTDRPKLSVPDEVDWSRVEESRSDIFIALGRDPMTDPILTPAARRRQSALAALGRGERSAGLASWQSQPEEPRSLIELALVGEALAEKGDAKAKLYADRLPAELRAESEAIVARLHARQGKMSEAAQALTAALAHYQHEPWAWSRILRDAMSLIEPIAAADKEQAQQLFQLLHSPFSIFALEASRHYARLNLANRVSQEACVDGLQPFEPYPPWTFSFLRARYDCYSKNGHPSAAKALADLEEFVANAPRPFSVGVLPAVVSMREQTPTGTGTQARLATASPP